MIRRLALTLTLLALASGSLFAQVADWKELAFPPLREVAVQQPKRIELPNGMIVFLQVDRELPLVSGRAMIRGGSREVPAPKTGLVDIYGDVWRTGGTTTRTGDELDDFLEARAAKVETSGGSDSTSIQFNTLSQELDAVFPIWLDLLRNPAFREEKIDLARRQMNTVISRRNDSPNQIASREAARLLWGDDSPYARVPEYATVAAVGHDDLHAFHKRTVHPNNIILGIVGDFDAKAMENRIRKAFGSWPRGPAIETPDIQPQPRKGIYLVPKDDVTQSTIVLLHPGARKDDPDYHAIQVFNEVFGGGFSGRLMNSIRTEKGLAYSVGGGIGTAYDRLAAFQITMGTKSESTVMAIEALHDVMARIRAEQITPQELELARESILNSFVFMLDSDEKVLNQRMTLEFYGYPVDFLERYQAGVRTVDVQAIQRVAQKFVRPDELALLVVGNPADFDADLSTRGEVTEIDITIPEPASAAASAPVESDAGARQTFMKMREFLGGDRIQTLQATRSTSEVQAVTPQGPMDLTQTTTLTLSPLRMHRVIKMAMGEITMVLDGDQAFVKTPMGVQDLPGSQRTALLQEVRLDPLMLAMRASDPALQVGAAGSETIEGVETSIIDVEVDGGRMKFWIDPATGRLLRRSQSTVMAGQPVEQVVDYRGWGEAGGIRYPSSVSITANGEPAGTATVATFEVDPSIDSTIFNR
ncbi:MAG: M16 family metallopeptidase [Thermoanaerobaculia bacterium]